MPGIDTYRLRTRWRALRKLYTLEEREIEAFMDSYRLFEGGWSHPNGKREEQLIDYYNVLNHLCSLGNVEKMYFPPHMDASVGVVANQTLFERKMARDIGAHEGMRLLDVGCGRGRVAHGVASDFEAHVTGINIDPSQIANARAWAEHTGFQDRTEFHVTSLNDPLPFDDESFDGGYEIQALSYAKDVVAVMTEIARVLKPGARFSALDWVLLPAYDPDDPKHVDLVDRARPLLGAVACPTVLDLEIAMEKAGLVVVSSENPGIDERQASLIADEDQYFVWLRRGVALGIQLRIFPAYFMDLIDRLMKNADALIELDRMGIGTTCYQIVAEKPEV